MKNDVRKSVEALEHCRARRSYIKAIRILGSLSSWQSLVEEAAIAVVNDPVGVGYVVRSGVGVNHLQEIMK